VKLLDEDSLISLWAVHC